MFELVGGKWVAIRRLPDLVGGLPLIVTFHVFEINAWHCAFCLEKLAPLDHVAHALVKVVQIVMACGLDLHFRGNVVEALLQQSAEVLLLHSDYVPALGTTLEVTLDHGL